MIIEQALTLLQAARGGSNAHPRDLIVAYATLCAYRDHWPAECDSDLKELLEHFQWIRAQEFDRFVKQRRIALSLLAQELSAPI